MVGNDCLPAVLDLGRGLHVNKGVVKLIPTKDKNKKEVCAEMTLKYQSCEKKSIREKIVLIHSGKFL
jgi:hypothetical protein